MSEISPGTPIGSPAIPSRPFRDRIGTQPAIHLGGDAHGDRDHLREERDTLASRNIFLAEQLDQRDAHIATLSQQLADARILATRLTAELDELRAQPAPDAPQYAIVELHGHVTLIGRISDAVIAGTQMLRIDRLDGRPPQFVPSWYRLTVCSEDEALKAHEAEQRRYYGPIGLPSALALALRPDQAAIAAKPDGSPWADDDDDEGGPF